MSQALRLALPRKQKLRPEVQALRALAVSLVVVYHYWPAALPGGFVGVDVFFAISGFLITSQLLKEVDRTGSVSMPSFWARRARRILPPALFVLLFCAVGTIVFVPLNYWQQFFAEMRASTTYGQNWHLASSAVNYFAQGQGPSPVEHYWSLSAEEQFYLVWPVLILVAVKIAGIGRVRIPRRPLAVVLPLLTLVSLGYGIWCTDADPAKAYFMTPTRAWEFGAGGLLALLPAATRNARLRSLVSWLGLGAIGIAAASYSDLTPFPGEAALLPVLGAVAVMWAGAPESRIAPTPVLARRPVQFLGDISYAVYLWHWPLFILAPFALGAAIHTDTKVVLVMLTILAAWLTKLGIEDPVRSGPLLVRRRARWTFGAAAAGTGMVLAVTFWGAQHVQAQIHKDERASEVLLASRPSCFGAAARDPRHPCSNPKLKFAVVPTPIAAANRPNSPCRFVQTRPFHVCAFGVPRAKATGTVALVGDSHASHWRAALEVVARKHGWYGLSITRSGCPFSRTVKVLRVPLFAQCIQWNHQLPHWFAQHPQVSTVFVVQESGQKWVVPRGQSEYGAEVSGFQKAWRSLPQSVKHVIVIHDTPKDRDSTAACVERAIGRHQRAGLACKVPRGLALDPDAEATAAAHAHMPRVQIVDLNRFFCDRRWCYPVIGGALVHKDQHHMTVVWATTLGPYLEHDVDRLITRWNR
jgi:peptidoglycan/LPS O-acetylase OafA/YrhL